MYCTSVCTFSVIIMRLICLWCAVLAIAHAQGDYYTAQTFKQIYGPYQTQAARDDPTHYPREDAPGMFQPVDSPWASSQRSDTVDRYRKAMFSPAADVTPQGSEQSWKPQPPPYDNYNKGPDRGGQEEQWRPPHSKERQASILHHKQSLSSEGVFRFEYASDTGLEAGEAIAPDGSRIGAYQYRDPAGRLVRLKYRAGKEGFQILEGSHLPKSPEPVAPPSQNSYYTQAYDQQKQQYERQREHDQQRPEPETWTQGPGNHEAPEAGNQYYNQNWKDGRDDGQYRQNELEENNRGPHSFGTGYAFAFKG